MPRCRKILANGKRCKAHAMAGSKFCLFHTPGQKMKRSKRKVRTKSESTKTPGQTRFEKTAKNQIIGRGTKKLGAYMVARGSFYASNKAIYDVTYRKNPARYNVQGTRIVGAHTQKTIEMRRTNGGRDFVATQTRTNRYGSPHHVHMGRKIHAYGRVIPVIGFGYVMYNSFSGSKPAPQRKGEGFGQMAMAYATADIIDHYRGGGTTVRMLTGGKYGAETLLERLT